jgi:5-methyltetrahydrofolate--homocysteine methyltransferase
MEILEQMSLAVQKGKAKDVVELTNQAIAGEMDPGTILQDGLLLGMSIIGERFKRNEAYVPEVLIAARAMKSGMELLRPLLISSGVKPRGKVLIGTVKGDLHDIGKNLVGMMLEGAGFTVVDAGVDVPCEKFVELAKEHQVDLIGVSALLTTTMAAMKEVVETIKGSDIASTVKVIIGGAPVTQAFCDEINADGYAADAATAADIAKSLVAA